jgi:hypothetical protein
MRGSQNVKGIRGSIPGKNKKLHSSVQDTSPMGTISFSRGEGGGGGEAVGAWNWTPSSTEAKNEWRFISAPPHNFLILIQTILHVMT